MRSLRERINLPGRTAPRRAAPIGSLDPRQFESKGGSRGSIPPPFLPSRGIAGFRARRRQFLFGCRHSRALARVNPPSRIRALRHTHTWSHGARARALAYVYTCVYHFVVCRVHWRAWVRARETEWARDRDGTRARSRVYNSSLVVCAWANRDPTSNGSRPIAAANGTPLVRAIGRMRRVAAIGGERTESAARATRRSASSFVAAQHRVRSRFARVSLRSSLSDADGHRASAYRLLRASLVEPPRPDSTEGYPVFLLNLRLGSASFRRFKRKTANTRR